mmetsp:Transcript_10814/g.14037  ORF Transcript_10814/g.14037 Transcript_10814/m.14037 type:complete len:391 (-) Transcript_10814:275-1447(-)|eukprot:CAMPEP_0117765660 /NCGR_PEP_ID=MMETSP0947-20121206/20286_1 /TAXON_ID=44440 /ORGANISM="Chattonella subsalsa, Strain CCMP2191" /LENGTH=390 /DNA_ID=CAMNT_0005588441 /DNA_START=52 /DNA_END=1224 /DNA_ORIENTATION=+
MMGLPIWSIALPSCSAVYALLVGVFRLSTYENISNSKMVVNAIVPFSLLGSVFAVNRLLDEDTRGIANASISGLSALAMFSMWYHCVRGRKFRALNMAGKICLVTGANAGIGFETTRELVKMGATVILGCRSEAKAQKAIQDILKCTGANKSQVQFIASLDLSSLESVRKFVETFQKNFKSLDVLINNAGIMMHERTVTKDGMEMLMEANHLGHALLTVLLIPLLEEKAEARIVNVSSSLYNMQRSFDFDDVMSENNYGMFAAYSKSKLAQILFSRQLHKELRNKGSAITVNSLHPGTVRTEITKNMHWLMRFGDILTHPIWLVLRKSPLRGAFTTLHVATAPELKDVSDKYFEHCEVSSFSAAARNEMDAKRVYDLTMSLVGEAKGKES